MKDFWNERYAEDGLAYGEQANEFLITQVSLLPPKANVLVIGDGEGRNGVWLAGQGFQVTSVDYSHVAIDKINAFAKERQVSVKAVFADLTTWDWPEETFDVVVSIYVHFPPDHRAQMHSNMIKALKPGGKIIMEAFHKEQLEYSSGGPPVEEMLFSEAMLKEDFNEAKILELYETITYLEEGKYHVGDGAVVRLIAEKPE